MKDIELSIHPLVWRDWQDFQSTSLAMANLAEQRAVVPRDCAIQKNPSKEFREMIMESNPASFLPIKIGLENNGSPVYLSIGLGEKELAEWVLPLRERVYNRELRWFLHPVSGSEDVRDRYDASSLHLGIVVAGRELVACARVIIAPGAGELPSGPYVGEGERFTAGLCCEMSRVVAERRYRNCGLFAILLKGTILAASNAGARRLYICEAENERSSRYLQAQGFRIIKTSFLFRDGIIEPPYPSTLYALELGENTRVGLTAEIRQLLEVVAPRLKHSPRA